MYPWGPDCAFGFFSFLAATFLTGAAFLGEGAVVFLVTLGDGLGIVLVIFLLFLGVFLMLVLALALAVGVCLGDAFTVLFAIKYDKI